MPARTLYDKLWDGHLVVDEGDGVGLIYIDRQLLHEVSSPQAFAGLRTSGRRVRRPEAQLCVADHAAPTLGRDRPIADPLAREQVALLARNAGEFGLSNIPLDSPDQGIVHVIGPELGFTLPGITLVCGDSHTSTHGAFGALAFGIGASQCETVLTLQLLRQTRARTLAVEIDGALAPGVFAKDIVLALVGRLGASGATGYAIEYRGGLVRGLSMEGRMTLCNMGIEAGSRTGLIAPDDTTFAYLEGRRLAPRGAEWRDAVAAWRALPSDAGARFDRVVRFDASAITPQVTWGTSPDQVCAVSDRMPDPALMPTAEASEKAERALRYMDLAAGQSIEGVAIDVVFIGSCTNGRIEDLRDAAAIAAGRKVAPGLQAIVVPGSGAVKRQAEAEGLDRVFFNAGFEWRAPGCSLCVAMNGDRVAPGRRCASTSNRNFEGRQGIGARTHLMSPASAAASAIAGQIADPRAFAG